MEAGMTRSVIHLCPQQLCHLALPSIYLKNKSELRIMNPLLFNSALPGHRRSLYSHARHLIYQFTILPLSPRSKL